MAQKTLSIIAVLITVHSLSIHHVASQYPYWASSSSYAYPSANAAASSSSYPSADAAAAPSSSFHNSAVVASTSSNDAASSSSSSTANYLDDYLAASSILQEVAESLHSFDDRLLKQKEDLWNEFAVHERKQRDKWTAIEARVQKLEREVDATKALADTSGRGGGGGGGGGAVVGDHKIVAAAAAAKASYITFEGGVDDELRRLVDSTVERFLARQSREILSRLTTVERQLPSKANRVEEELRKNEIGRWETELRMFSKKLMEMEQMGLGHGPTGWKTSMEDRLDQIDAKTVQNLQEWKRLENKINNENRNLKNDVNLLKKQTKDLEYGHQRLKGLMTNFQQKTQREADHGKRIQALDEKVRYDAIYVKAKRKFLLCANQSVSENRARKYDQLK